MDYNSYTAKMQNLHDLAMLRFNFWHKPFLSPPAAHQPFPHSMESSSFIPNPMGTPALMVLASTAENHEPGRISGAPRFSNAEVKDSSTPQFNAPNFTMYRPGEPFPTPVYAPVHPLVHQTAERAGMRLMHPAGSSAFRPVAGETQDQLHSAFSPAKRPKPEDLSVKASHTFSSDLCETHDVDKEERPSSLSSVNYDTNSDSLSEHGDRERGTPDSEGRSLRSKFYCAEKQIVNLIAAYFTCVTDLNHH